MFNMLFAAGLVLIYRDFFLFFVEDSEIVHKLDSVCKKHFPEEGNKSNLLAFLLRLFYSRDLKLVID